MTITNFNDLRDWFKFGFEKGVKSVEEGRETSSPYWTLYSVGLGGKDTVLAFNDRLTGLDESYTALVESIRRMNNPAGSMFRIFQTYRARGNNPTQEARVQIFESNLGGGNAAPGIGSLPVGYVTVDAIAEAVATAREKWDMEARIQALENQPDEDWMAKLERIAAIPAVQMFIGGIMAKKGIPMPPIGMTGMPSPDNSALPNDGNDFDANIERTTQILGVSEEQLAAKIRQFAEQQPEVARQFFQA